MRAALFLLPALLLGCPANKSADDTGTSPTDDTAEAPPDLVGDCTTEACGGDPTGEWTIVDTCFDDSEKPLDNDMCPEGTLTLLDVTVTGNVSIGTDGTFTTAVDSFESAVLIHLPSSCLGPATCEQVQDGMNRDLPDAVCTDAEDGCDCTATVTDDPTTDAGTWSTMDTTITFASDDGSDPETDPYCADSDELWVQITGDDGNVFSLLLTK